MPLLTTSDHSLGLAAWDGETFLPLGEGVTALTDLDPDLVGVSPALLLMTAVSFGVASLPWMALIATAFLKSAGGDMSSLPGVVVSFVFLALGGLADTRLFADTCGLAGLSGVAYFAGVGALGLLAGDFAGVLALGLLEEDFAGVLALGLLAGDFAGLLPLGLLAGDFAGLLAGDFAGVFALGLLAGDFAGVFALGLLALALGLSSVIG